MNLVRLLKAGAFVTAVFSVLTFFDQWHRLIEMFAHFRVQYLGVSLLLALVFTALRSWPWAGTMLAITLINVSPVAAWYLENGTDPGVAGQPIRIVQANVLGHNDQHGFLLDFIMAEQPDLVFLQEVTGSLVAAMEALRSDYPHSYTVPRDDNFGIAVYARKPLLSVDEIASPPLGLPTLLVRQSINGRVVTFVTTHPVPPLNAARFASRNEQLASIADLLASVAAPKVLAGDLNTTMWAHHYRKLADRSGLVNARKGFGVLPTWPRQLPIALIPIDHCLVSEDIAVLDARTGPDIKSDHLPLVVTLAIRPERF